MAKYSPSNRLLIWGISLDSVCVCCGPPTIPRADDLIFSYHQKRSVERMTQQTRRPRNPRSPTTARPSKTIVGGGVGRFEVEPKNLFFG